MAEPSLKSFDDMRIEVASHRLIIRAILTYLSCTNQTGNALTEISSMLEGTGPYAVIAEDLDDALRKAAIDRTRIRMFHFLTDIEKLPLSRG